MLVRRVDCRLHPFRTDQRFTGVIESAGFGVTPDPDVIGKLEPDVRRTLNWVHIAARSENPPLELLRIGETTVVTIGDAEHGNCCSALVSAAPLHEMDPGFSAHYHSHVHPCVHE